jgi:hypothetical protein
MAWRTTIENFNWFRWLTRGRIATSEKRPTLKGQTMNANFNNINSNGKADIMRSALFTLFVDAIINDSEAQFLSNNEMLDLAHDHIYNRGPTDYEVEAMLFYHYNHGFMVAYNTVTQNYDMMPPASYNDEPSIAHAMFEMYGYTNRPYFFVN